MNSNFSAQSILANDEVANTSLASFGLEGKANSALLFIPPHKSTTEELKQTLQPLTSQAWLLGSTHTLPAINRVLNAAERLADEVLTAGAKRVTVFGVGAGATVAQALTVVAPELVRRLVLLDATARLTPSFAVRAIDWLERYLPLGLPLRQLTDDFDSRPYLHRMRAPTMVLVSPNAGLYIKHQGNFIAAKLPNATLWHLHSTPINPLGELSAEIINLLTEFQQVPTKLPQRG